MKCLAQNHSIITITSKTCHLQIGSWKIAEEEAFSEEDSENGPTLLFLMLQMLEMELSLAAELLNIPLKSLQFHCSLCFSLFSSSKERIKEEETDPLSQIGVEE